MKKILIFLCLYVFVSPAHAQEDAWTYTNPEDHPGKQEQLSPKERQEDLEAPGPLIEDMDPLESLNRGIFLFNEFLELVLFTPIGMMYRDLIPEDARTRVGYMLRNLSEPIVFVNNILQGDLEDARVTFTRFLLNTTVGIGGVLDVSTTLDFPYKKEDFGLTLACWGVDTGPYIMLPVLGPSTLRDTFGRIGDYAFDPINWWAFFTNQAVYSYTRTAIQIVDAKSDSYDVMEDLRKNSLDYYATIRAWYLERRKALAAKDFSRENGESPRPEDEEDE